MKVERVLLLFALLIMGSGFLGDCAAVGREKRPHVTTDASHASPATFRELPEKIQRWLTARGYSIPQSAFQNGPHNVIRGSFLGAGETDWAVLASRADSSAVLVFGADGEPLRIAQGRPDRGDWTMVDEGRMGYSRMIRAVTAAAIVAEAIASGDTLPVTPEHDGIEDAWVERASWVWYYTGREWVVVGGSD